MQRGEIKMTDKKQDYVFDVLCKLLPTRFLQLGKIDEDVYDICVFFADVSEDLETFEANKIELISFQDLPLSNEVRKSMKRAGYKPDRDERGYPHYVISTKNLDYDHIIVKPTKNIDIRGNYIDKCSICKKNRSIHTNGNGQILICIGCDNID